ncbi:MAG: hypothetical protein IKB10_00230, partial [Alphaproteobacteria bacterium]|nr:hypothetical protein [Alphaproteobacteria bacterium]
FNHWVQGSSPCVPTKNSTTACRSFNFCMGRGREPKKGSERQLVKTSELGALSKFYDTEMESKYGIVGLKLELISQHINI